MSITITITDPTPEQIAALFGTQGSAKTSEKAEPKKTEPAPKSEPAADAPSEDSTASVPTKDDLTAAAQALVAANGRDALAELVEKFKAKNLSSIAEGDRAAFIAQCEEKTK